MHLIRATLVFTQQKTKFTRIFGAKPQFLKENWGFFIWFNFLHRDIALYWCDNKNNIAFSLAKKTQPWGKLGR